MHPSRVRSGLLLALGWMLLSTASCNQLNIPRFGFDDEDLVRPRIPVSTTLVFDEQVREATLQVDACGLPWEGHLGHVLATEFLETARERFETASMEDPGESGAGSPGGPNPLIIEIGLLRKSLDGSTRTGNEDTYSAVLNVQLMAVVADADGNPIGKAPLSYRERVNVWTPILMGAQGTCPTGQLDAMLEEAAGELADQMVAAVGAWYGETQARAAPPAAAPADAPSSARGPSGPIALRTTLLDENDDLILESGEKIGVRIDATNKGGTIIPAATISLTGTSSLVEAFASAATGALEIGPLAPGETKSTMFWGRLGTEVTDQRGELVVSVGAREGTSSQTLVAAMRPTVGTPRAQAPPPPARAQAGKAIARAVPQVDRQAVLIKLSSYDTPWSVAGTSQADRFPHLIRALRTTANLSRESMLVLTNRSATRAGWEEGLLRWLPAKVTPKSVVLVYVSTKGVADEKNGEIFLIPYDGRPQAPRRSLISLHALQGTLKRMNASVCLLLLDVPLAETERTKPRLDWQGVINSSGRASTRLIQVVGSDPSAGLDGALVRALNGEADRDGNGQVTVGELLDYVQQASNVYPTVPASAPERAIPLTG